MPGWASALVYLLVFVVGQFIAREFLQLPLALAKSATLGVSLSRIDARGLMDPTGLGLPLWCFFWSVIGWGALLVTLLLTATLAHWLERRTLFDLGLRPWRTLPRDLIAGPALALVLFCSLVGLGAARGLYDVQLAATAREVPVVLAAGFVLLLPFAALEEIAMRGYVFHAAKRSWGAAGAVAASTLAFTALHAMNPHFAQNPLAILGLALAGLYLASAYLITGNLWLAIFLHTGWNLMEGPVFGLPVSGAEVPASIFRTHVSGPSLWTGGAFGPEAGLLLCLLLLVHLAALWAMRPVFRPREAPAAPAPVAS